MTPKTETLRFQAEVKELLGLMIHSLYSHREIFLRELVSNASDALDKLRFEALTRSELLAGDERLAIRLEVDARSRALAIRDNGIGMGHDELVTHLSTIASSGTRKFLESLRARGGERTPELIGQFGVGFYSCFMVSERVTVDTRRAGEDRGWRWSSAGDGEFTLEEREGLPRGTTVTLALKPADDEQDFAEPAELASLVRRYSDFVGYPIEMAAAHFKERGDLVKSTAPDGLEVARLNSMQPLWARPKEEITEREYADFFRHVAHEFSDPLETLHFKAEGASEYTALLFLPSERPFDLFDPGAKRSHVALYVRRVFVMGECEDLVPSWLRFVRGVVDSSDLPLNVSREILQKNRTMAQIKKHVTKKVLAALADLGANRRADYLKFAQNFGSVLKEGALGEADDRDALAPLLVFATTHESGSTTLAEYVGRMPAHQTAIYVLAGEDRERLARSPQLEAALAKGFEVLLFVDPIDEWVLERLREFQGKPLVALDRGEPDFVDAATKSELQDLEREHRGLCEDLERGLGGAVARVRFGARAVESPAVLVDEPHALGRGMARFLRETGRDVPERKRVLELNPKHPVVQRLIELHREDARSPRVEEFTELLHGQALLAEGSPLPDPTKFSKLVAKLMLGAGA